jgi:glycosyltransferase involved in cell wall biosynthesis
VIEAMAVGLPVMVTPVGGINDFFDEELMGSFISIKDINSIVEKAEKLYLNSAKRKAISKYNLAYAKDNFKDEVVFEKLKNIINGFGSD